MGWVHLATNRHLFQPLLLLLASGSTAISVATALSVTVVAPSVNFIDFYFFKMKQNSFTFWPPYILQKRLPYNTGVLRVFITYLCCVFSEDSHL